MIPEERRNKILMLIEEMGSASIADLSKRFFVSEMTIYRDLNVLESTGRIHKTYGGVMSNKPTIKMDFNQRLDTNKDAKEIIGAAAAGLVKDGDCIIMDASTSCLMMIPGLLLLNSLTIFTNGSAVFSQLSNRNNCELYSTGGQLYADTNWLVGPETTRFIRNIHADKCFLSAACVSIAEGATVPVSLISEVEQVMAESSDETILLVDQSKFGHVSRFKVLPLDACNLLVTDAESGDPFVSKLIKKKINILHAIGNFR